MNIGGFVSLLEPGQKRTIACLSQLSNVSFNTLNIILPIFYDSEKKNYYIKAEKEEEILINDSKLTDEDRVLRNGDIVCYKGHYFRVSLIDYDLQLSFDSFWHDNLYFDNLPVFSDRAFSKLMDIEIEKCKRYNYPFCILLLRFNEIAEEKKKEIVHIICENVRFTDMICCISDYEILVYLHQVKESNIDPIIKKIEGVIKNIFDLSFKSVGVQYKLDYSNFNEIIDAIYCKYIEKSGNI
jgi:hypothetical protein